MRYAQKVWIEDSLRHVVYLPFRVIDRKSRRCSVGGKDTPMHRVHQEEPSREEFVLDLDAIAREGAKRMLAQALEAEVEIYLETTRGERDEQGRAKAAPWWCAT